MDFNRRILVVDDNPDIQEDFRKILITRPNPADAGLAELEAALFGATRTSSPVAAFPYRLDAAYSAEEALRKVAAAQAEGQPYALVFMDVRMPQDDGVTATVKLWDVAPHTEVVLCSAYADYSWEDVIQALGVSERLLFLRKPYDAMEVRQMALSLTTKWSLGRTTRALIDHLEEEVRKRAAELNHERAQRVEAAKMAALGEMAASIAHEINNPLAIIHGNASLLDSWFANEGLFARAMAKTMAERILNTSKRIAKIIKGLKEIARDGSSDPLMASDVSHIVTNTVEICAIRFRAAGIDLRVDLPDAPAIAPCRPVQMSQVLLNLMNNAFDAVQGLPGAWVRLAVTHDDASLDLAVEDSGPGVAPAIRDRILLPFFTTKDIGKGTGLGLSIAKSIVDAHNGLLFLDEAHPHTRFVVRLPKGDRTP